MRDGLHEGDSPDPAGVAGGPVEAQRSAPVMAHEGHTIDLEFLEPGVQIAAWSAKR
jgi:hypothetical protein